MALSKNDLKNISKATESLSKVDPITGQSGFDLISNIDTSKPVSATALSDLKSTSSRLSSFGNRSTSRSGEKRGRLGSSTSRRRSKSRFNTSSLSKTINEEAGKPSTQPIKNVVKDILSDTSKTVTEQKVIEESLSKIQSLEKDILGKDINDPTRTAAILASREAQAEIDTIKKDATDAALLRDRESLERDLISAKTTGIDEDILEQSSKLLNFAELEKSVSDQAAAKQEADRTLFRQREAAQRAGEELTESSAEIARRSETLSQDLLRGRSSIDRQAALAASSDQQVSAQIANFSSQSLLGGSSALQGARGQAAQRAANRAGEISTQLVGLEQQGAEQRAQLETAGNRITRARGELQAQSDDIEFAQSNLSINFDRNIDFLRETFDLGGDVVGAQERLFGQQQAEAKRAAQRAGTISGLVSGAGLGASIAGPYGAIAGGLIGAFTGGGGDFSDIFDF